MRNFIKKTLLGGLVVILPASLLFLFIRWLFTAVTDLIKPLTSVLIKQYSMPTITADILGILIILSVCFILGLLVSTEIGKWLHDKTDRHLSRFAPGYRFVKEVVGQIFGDKDQSPFANGEVVRAYVLGREIPTTVTAIVTSRHNDGHLTIFVPTGPNPTSGLIFHVPEANVDYIECSVEDMMRTAIGCGAGSGRLFAGMSLAPQQEPKQDPKQASTE